MPDNYYSFFFSDIVGYSKMVDRDEKLAFTLLQEHNRIIETSVHTNHGRIVKFIGDSIFAEFKNPDQACTAAIIIQEKLNKRNNISRQEEHIIIRLGIHMGQAIEKDEDLFGNDVNIASRIESVAQPGTIFISEKVLQNLNSPNKYFARKIEHVKLKNIPLPQTLFKLYNNDSEKKIESSFQLKERLIENGLNIINQKEIQDYGKQSIGVLLFHGVGDNFFGYGLTNDLINDFDRINQIYVADIQDVFKFASTDYSIADIARKLQVDNILEGTYKIENKTIQLSIRLVSILTGQTIFSEEIKDSLRNINIMKARILKTILEKFEIQVPEFILDNMSVSITKNPKAYGLYQKGLYKIEIIKSKNEYHSARSLFKDALEKDGNFVEAQAQYAITSNKMGYTEEAEEVIDRALEIADNSANELRWANILDSMGILNKAWGKYRKATKCFEKSLKIQTKYENKLSEAKTLNNLSGCYNNFGDEEHLDQSIEVLERSIYLKESLEKDKLLGTSYAQLGNAYIGKFHYANAIMIFQKALGKFNYYNNEYYKGRVLFLLARCYCDIGYTKKADEYLKRSKIICNNFNEPLLMGRISWIEARIFISKNEYPSAITKYNQSIEYFRKGDLRKAVIDTLLEMILLNIKYDNVNAIQNLIHEYSGICNKMIDANYYHILLNCFNYYLDIQQENKYNELDISSLEKEINTLQSKETMLFAFWVIGKISGLAKNHKKEKLYYSKSCEIIHHLSDCIGNNVFKEYFINKHPIVDIMNSLQ